MSLLDAYAALSTALTPVRGVRYYSGPRADIETPAAVLLPPEQDWRAIGSDPTDASFTLALVVAEDDRMIPNLVTLTQRVVEAVDGVRGAVVRHAEPGRFRSGQGTLPAYLITIEVSP